MEAWSEMKLLIEQAAAWLDVRYPRWAEKIDIDDFSMHDMNRCIGSYLGVDWGNDLRDGFHTDTGLSGIGVFAGFTDDWLEEIDQRVSVPSPV